MSIGTPFVTVLPLQYSTYYSLILSPSNVYVQTEITVKSLISDPEEFMRKAY